MLLAALGGLALLARPSLRQKLIEAPAVAKKEGLMTWHRSKYFHHRVEAAVLFNPCVLVGSWLAAGGAAFAAPLSPGTIVVAESNQFTSSPNDSLIAVDPATGATTTISDNAIGSGPSFNFGTDGAFISYISQQSDGSLLVVDSSESVVDSFGPGPASPSVPYESRLYRVDPSTGDRTLIADSTGTTPDNAIWAARQVGNTIFATTKAGLETIDPVTGAISPFTIGGAGVTPPLLGFVNIGTEIYAASRYDTIYKIDSLTGNSTVLSSTVPLSPSVGLGPTLTLPIDLAVDSMGNLYADSNDNVLYRINTTTGDRTVVSASPETSGDPSMGTGPALDTLSIGVSSTGAILADNISTGSLLSIDPTTGNRTVVSQLFTQTGATTVFAGVAVISNAPEPSTLILAALGGLALLTRSRAGNRLLHRPQSRRRQTS